MIVLAMITRNSAERIKDFPEVLNSTLSIPYESMILVDDSGTSTTKNSDVSTQIGRLGFIGRIRYCIGV